MNVCPGPTTTAELLVRTVCSALVNLVHVRQTYGQEAVDVLVSALTTDNDGLHSADVTDMTALLLRAQPLESIMLVDGQLLTQTSDDDLASMLPSLSALFLADNEPSGIGQSFAAVAIDDHA